MEHTPSRWSPEEPLDNIQWEVFAQNVAKGMSLIKAHEGAGYSGDTKNASELRHRPEVHARILFLVRKAASEGGIDIATWFKEQVAIATWDPIHAVNWGTDRDGKPFFYVRDAEDMDPFSRRMIKQIQARVKRVTREDGSVEDTVDIKLDWRDGQVALREIGKHLGAYEADNHQKRTQENHLHLHDLRGMTRQELEAELSRLQEGRKKGLSEPPQETEGEDDGWY